MLHVVRRACLQVHTASPAASRNFCARGTSQFPIQHFPWTPPACTYYGRPLQQLCAGSRSRVKVIGGEQRNGPIQSSTATRNRRGAAAMSAGEPVPMKINNYRASTIGEPADEYANKILIGAAISGLHGSLSTHRYRRARPRRPTRCRSPAPPPATTSRAKLRAVPSPRAGRPPRRSYLSESARGEIERRAERARDRSAPLFSAAIFWWRCDLRAASRPPRADTHLLGNVLLIQRMRSQLVSQEFEHY